MNLFSLYLKLLQTRRAILCSGLCLLLSACITTQPIPAPVGDREKRAIPADGYHQVKRGETLYAIAWLYGLDGRQLANWNHIQPPYTIYADQRLRLSKPPPAAAKSAPKRDSRKKKVTRRPIPSSTPKTTKKPVIARQDKSRPATPAKPKMSKRLGWQWPADGGLSSRFDAKQVGRKGISIAGKPGDPVRAAAAGKVVYAGSGLSGYGRLIIIKHNQDFLSAYAHNRKLIAKEGDWVKGKQVIAQMGKNSANRTQLYFEIRKHGTPVDPLRYLPKR